MTALHHASANGHADVVARLLADHHLNASILDASGNTALHWASDAGHEEVVRHLVVSIDPSAVAQVCLCFLRIVAALTRLLQDGRTALHRAVGNHHVLATQVLLPNSDVNLGDQVMPPPPMLPFILLTACRMDAVFFILHHITAMLTWWECYWQMPGLMSMSGILPMTITYAPLLLSWPC